MPYMKNIACLCGEDMNLKDDVKNRDVYQKKYLLKNFEWSVQQCQTNVGRKRQSAQTFSCSTHLWLALYN